MSATAKTLGSMGVAVLGLVLYCSIYLGLGIFKISLFGAALYLGLGLTATMLVLIVAFTLIKADDESEAHS